MVYKKGIKVSLTTHFSTADFDCRCTRKECVTTQLNTSLPTALESLYNISGHFKINSGYRCPAHNLEVGGASHSQHTLGNAADIESLEGKSGEKMAEDADFILQFSTGGIGTAEKWIHVDVRGIRARWTYPITKC